MCIYTQSVRRQHVLRRKGFTIKFYNDKNDTRGPFHKALPTGSGQIDDVAVDVTFTVTNRKWIDFAVGVLWGVSARMRVHACDLRKERNVLFNDVHNTFYIRLHGVGHIMLKGPGTSRSQYLKKPHKKPHHKNIFTIIVSRCYNELNFFLRLTACSTKRPYLTVIID